MTALRWTRGLAWATVAAAGVLLTLGWLVTSFQAGMADPVWPTEPWYLVVNGHVWNEPKTAFLLEHTHRLAGFTVGALATLLAVAAWATEPRRLLKWYGVFSVVALVAVYGQFHREMGVAWTARQAGDPAVTWPAGSGLITAVFAAILLRNAAATAGPGRWVRRLASVSLVTVMAQGLLGGYRVYLNQLAGVELAAVHGTFGQVVFCLLLATLVFTRPPCELPDGERERLGRLALALPALLFVQLVWGVLVRHTGGSLVQRLHLLTAFAATALCVWLAARILATADGRRHLRGAAYHLIGLVLLQVTLGVEAWMGKFAAAGPEAATPPMLRHLTVAGASTRTLHALVGAGLLATAVLLAVRVWRRAERPTPDPVQTERAVEAVAA